MLNLLSLLQSIWVLISTIYLKPMERLLGISVKRHQLYSSALKKCNAWWNELFQSRYDSLLCESATLQRRACLHLFLLFFCVQQQIAIHSFFPFFFFFTAMHLFKEQQRKFILLLMLKYVQDLKVKHFCFCISGISFAAFCKAGHTNSSSGVFEDKIVNRIEKTKGEVCFF